MTRTRPLALILKAGAFAALLATLFSAATIELLAAFADRVNGSTPRLWDIAKATVLLCAITIVPAGSFGFLAAVVAGTVLYLRRDRIRSVRRLLVESSAAGLVMGCLFPVFDAAVNSLAVPSFRSWLSRYELVFCVPVAVLCAVLSALLFRKHVVR